MQLIWREIESNRGELKVTPLRCPWGRLSRTALGENLINICRILGSFCGKLLLLSGINCLAVFGDHQLNGIGLRIC